MKNTYFRIVLFVLTIGLSATFALADHDGKFCENNWSNSRHSSFKELREKTISSVGKLEVDGMRNGGVSVKGENRSDILIRACVRTWADTDAEAQSKAKNINIATSPVVRAENTPEKGWSVSYQILVPKSTGLKLTAHNGGISIGNVEGNIEFETRNGGISLKDVGGNVKGVTRNGGISVKLSGNSFKGSGLNVETKNGGINLSLPSNYRANIETGTVNGGMRSDFAELQAEKKNRWYRPKHVKASLNGGGAPIRVVTTNGGVRIRSN